MEYKDYTISTIIKIHVDNLKKEIAGHRYIFAISTVKDRFVFRDVSEFSVENGILLITGKVHFSDSLTYKEAFIAINVDHIVHIYGKLSMIVNNG